MEVRGPGNIGGINPLSKVDLVRTQATQATGKVVGKDTVEISQLARMIDALTRVPDVRMDKVNAVRAQIESGVYETSEKLDRAIDAMIREM